MLKLTKWLVEMNSLRIASVVDVGGGQRQFHVIPTSDNGDCLFEALSLGLFDTTVNTFHVRSNCVTYVSENWEELQVQTEAPGHQNFQDVFQYVVSMGRRGTWGGMSELTAASRVFDVQIIVYELHMPPMFFGEPNMQRTVTLLYTHQNGEGGHFQLLKEIEEFIPESMDDGTHLDDVSQRESDRHVIENASNASDGSGNNTFEADGNSDSCGFGDDSDNNVDDDECDDMESGTHVIGGAHIVDEFTREIIPNEDDEEDRYCWYNSVPGVRMIPVKEPSSNVMKKPSLELQAGRLCQTYMWAARYENETDQHIEMVTLGACENVCLDCGALFWASELRVRDGWTPATCCGSEVKVSATAGGSFKEIDDPEILSLYTGTSERARHFQHHIRAYNRILSVAFPVGDYRNLGRGDHRSIVVNGAVKFQAHSFPEMMENRVPYNHGQLYMVDMTEETLEQRMAQSTVANRLDVEVLSSMEEYLRRRNALIQQFMYAGEVQRQLEEEDDDGEAGDPANHVVLVVNPRRGGFRDTDRNLFDSVNFRGSRTPGNDSVAAVFIGPLPSYNYDMVFFPRDREIPGRVGRRRSRHFIVNVAASTLDTMVYPLIHLHNEDSWLQVVVRSRRKRLRDEGHDGADEPNNSNGSVTDSGTLRAYYAFRLQKRSSDSGVLLKSRALLLQWLIDAAVRVIDRNLDFARQNQTILQVCRYDHLESYVQDVAQRMDKRPGRICVMPSNEQRSERQLYVDYCNAVRISTEFGAPTLFLTFTANPGWQAIKDELAAVDMEPKDYVHRPDILVRVFTSMKQSFLSDIVHKCVLGRVMGYVSVDEFQKTGLPHTHLAVILHPADRPVAGLEIDRILSAEIPTPGEDKELHELVMTLMIHRPCDAASRRGQSGSRGGRFSNCWDHTKKRCKHGFPQAFADCTVLDRYGPRYRRRRGPQYWHRGYQCFVDNRWVVPFNARLLRRYGNHQNVLVCAPALPFKYIYGYMDKMKTGDTAHVTRYTYSVNNSRRGFVDWDEIKHFEAMRYLGPHEAVYRIYGKSFGERSHAVYPLPIHLPRQQIIYYDGSELDVNLQDNSKFIAWFRLNRDDPPSQALYYEDVCRYYKWSKGDWVKLRHRANCLGRIMNVNPSPRNMELFHLRCLVKNVPGAKGFEELLTVGGVVYETFREACKARGLVFDGDYYEEALQELTHFASPRQIRMSFAVIVTNCEVSDVHGLWLHFRRDMSLDHLDEVAAERDPVLLERAFVKTRAKVLSMIVSFGGNAADFESSLTVPSHRRTCSGAEGRGPDSHSGFDYDGDFLEEEVIPSQLQMLPEVDIGEGEGCVTDIGEESQVTADQGSRENTTSFQLNEDQQEVLYAVMSSVMCRERPCRRLFTVSGPAGTGKTYLYQAIVAECKKRGIDFICSAFMAIASKLLPEGKTCHSAFGIPIRNRMDGTDVTYLERCSEQGLALQRAKLIIIDEMSMVAAYQIEIIDKCLRMMDDTDSPMGNKVVLLGGDMQQILPVFKGFSIEQTVDKALPSWSLWNSFEHFKLTTNMRALNDPVYASWTQRVGDGTANLHRDTHVIELPENIVLQSSSKDETVIMNDLITKVFGDVIHDSSAVLQNVILCPTNQSVDEVNEEVLKRFPEGTLEMTYLCTTRLIPEGRDCEQNDAEDEYQYTVLQDELDAMSPSNLPPQKLHLKEGCVVMLMRNLSHENGLCNGSRLLVVSLHDYVIGLKKINEDGTVDDELIFLPRVKLRSDEAPVGGTLIRYQFPLKLAHAMTIKKSQGKTLGRVGLFLKRPVFTHGQLYVAVTRSRSSADVVIAIVPGPHQGRMNCHRGGKKGKNAVYTLNIVYREVLI